MKKRTFFRFLLATGIVLLLVPFAQRSRHVHRLFLQDLRDSVIRIVIVPDVLSTALGAGYAWDATGRMAADARCLPLRSIARDSSWTDSLRLKKPVLLAIPSGDSLLRKLPVRISTEMPGHYVLAVPSGYSYMVKDINRWLRRERISPHYAARVRPYLSPWRPGKGMSATTMSPYDDLLRTAPLPSHWDWHLLAAICYKESKFHIDACSRKGAAGLMQLIPSTARRFGAEDSADPAQGILAAARYLIYIDRLLQPYVGDEGERCTLTVASYNAGEGRILQCLRSLDSLRQQAPSWQDVIEAIPAVEGFRGHETIQYVDEVFSLYDQIRQSLPSSQGQPAQ